MTRNTKTKTLAGLSDKELLKTKLGDLMQARLKTNYISSSELLKDLKATGKLPKWLLTNGGELYLSVGEVDEGREKCYVFLWCSTSGRFYPMYGYVEGSYLRITRDVWLTIPAPTKTQAISKKLKLLAEHIREKNLIGEVIHQAHTPESPLKLWKMHIRGMLQDSSIVVDKAGNPSFKEATND